MKVWKLVLETETTNPLNPSAVASDKNQIQIKVDFLLFRVQRLIQAFAQKFQILDFPANVTTKSMTLEMGMGWRYPEGKVKVLKYSWVLGNSSSAVLMSNESFWV